MSSIATRCLFSRPVRIRDHIEPVFLKANTPPSDLVGNIFHNMPVTDEIYLPVHRPIEAMWKMLLKASFQNTEQFCIFRSDKGELKRCPSRIPTFNVNCWFMPASIFLPISVVVVGAGLSSHYKSGSAYRYREYVWG